MEFDVVVEFVVDIWEQMLNLLHSIKFSLFGYDVDFLSVLAVLFVIGFVVTVFWRGAKT